MDHHPLYCGRMRSRARQITAADTAPASPPQTGQLLPGSAAVIRGGLVQIAASWYAPRALPGLTKPRE